MTVAAIRLGLWILSFKSLRGCLTQASRKENEAGDSHAVDRIIWAVKATSRRVPKATCLTQALAAQVMDNFHAVYKYTAEVTPLRRNMTIDDVGRTALYLLSDLSGAVTGETHHMDGGFSALGMTCPERMLKGSGGV